MEKSVFFKGQTVAYQIEDSRQPHLPVLMLVHGFPEQGSIFKFQMEALKEYAKIIIPDLPGSGKSPYNKALLSVEDFADLCFDILQAEKIPKIVLIGHSMGGYISLAFAEKYPASLAALGLLHSTAYADSPEKKENRLRSITLMEKFGGPAFLKTVIPGLFGSDFKDHHPSVVAALIATGENFETVALQQYYQIMHDRPDRTAVLKAVAVPVLFIIGSEDQAAPAKDVLAQASLPAIAQVTLLQGVGHMGFLEARKKVDAAILSFLRLEKIKMLF